MRISVIVHFAANQDLFSLQE